MNRQRYELVTSGNEAITLETLDNINASNNYNYNSGIPSSVASSVITGSSTSRSQTPTPLYTPSASSSYHANPYNNQRSPPPSFHTLSSPGTPRPGPAHSIRTAHSGGQELWGVASTIGGTETETYAETENIRSGGIGTSNDALVTIAGLRNRVEWLEESIGRLLIEKDTISASQTKGDVEAQRDNCCVTFTSTTPEMERAIAGRRTNCCVTFRSSEAVARRANAMTAVKLVLFALIVMFVTLGVSGRSIGNVMSGAAGKGDHIMTGDVDGKAQRIESTNEIVGLD